MKKGNRGHHELLIPTVLYHNGFSLRDFGGNGRFIYDREELFHTNKNIDKYYTNTMRFRPQYHIEDVIVLNKLYHPIKEVSGNYILGFDIINNCNMIIRDTEWLRDKHLDFSDYAVDEAYVTYMIKILKAHSFKNILDFGCG